MDGRSITPEKGKLNALRQILPEAFSEGKIDWEKLKAALGENINFANERYVLNWAGKSDAFKVLQTPTTKTLIPAKEESVNFDDTQNIFIEGENLEVLKILQKSYFGKVKMIYIDPPYNTGNDSFIYPDKFSESKADYEKRVGDKDENGNLTKATLKFPSIGGVSERTGWSKNSKENGQYHSNWLNMMMPRLYLAKNLLRQDGVIFVSIDDNEVHNLRLLMNEIFGEENFIADIVWEKRYTRSNDAKMMASLIDHNLFFRKADVLNFLREPRTEKANSIYNNPDNDPNGPWTSVSYVSQRTKEQRPNLAYSVKHPIDGRIIEHPTNAWKFSIEQYNKHLSESKLYWGKDGGQTYPRLKKYISEVENTGMVPINLWNHRETGTVDDGTKEVDNLIGKDIFDYPKPISLIKRAMRMVSSNEEDIILDFFAGSGTTAHAVMDLNAEDGGNRKYICVQLPEMCDEKSEAYKAGYKTIADIAKERIRRAGKKINEELKIKIEELQKEIEKLQGELPTEETIEKIQNLEFKIQNLHNQDLGFKVFKLNDSNFKQWQQIESKDLPDRQANAKALEEQMKLFVDPVSESATIENMVYELLLKSGKDLNSSIEEKFPSFGGVPAGRGGSKEVQIGRNSQNYFNLPINPKLKKRARELRQAGNLAEVLIWNQVKSKQFKGFDFDRQKIVGNYIVDFYCCNCNVVIEIDGSSHDDKQEYDAERDAYLKSLGLTVIHIEDADVKKNISGVMDMLYHHPALKGTPPKEGNSVDIDKGGYYEIEDGELILLLENATGEIIDTVIAAKPVKVIALDKLFKGNDQLKTNTVLQMKDAGIEFKTI